MGQNVNTAYTGEKETEQQKETINDLKTTSHQSTELGAEESEEEEESSGNEEKENIL